MDWIMALAIGAIVGVIGGGAFTWWFEKNPAQQQPYCGCEHHYAFHERESGKCRRKISRNGSYEQCDCPRYAGPPPPEDNYLK